MVFKKNPPEKKLILILNNYQKSIAPHTNQVAHEVNSGYGIADIVFFNLDSKITKKRTIANIPAIKSYEILETFSVINKLNTDKINITQLYKKLPYSENVFKKKILSFLFDYKIAQNIDNSYIKLNFNYKIALRKTVAIEAKINNWRRGFYQAYRYKQYADLSFLALCSTYLNKAVENIHLFKKLNIGLISVNVDLEEATVLYRPKREAVSIAEKVKSYATEDILLKKGLIR